MNTVTFRVSIVGQHSIRTSHLLSQLTSAATTLCVRGCYSTFSDEETEAESG